MARSQTSLVIDDKLRFVLFGLECALDAEFNPAEVERIFTDASEDHVSAKHYLLYDRLGLRIECDVDEYEPEAVWVRVESKEPFSPSLAAVVERAGYQIYRIEARFQ